MMHAMLENGLCSKYFSDYISGFVLRFSSPFHVTIDNKSLSSEDTSKVDEVFDEPLSAHINEEVNAIEKEGIINFHGVIVVDFVFGYCFNHFM